MKYLALAALFALAACGQQQEEAPAPAAPAGPQGALEALQTLPPDQQPVTAWQHLTTYQSANAIEPACTSIRRAEARGVVPANIDPESIYAPYIGSTVFAIQCGPQLTTVRDNPAEHWLMVYTPGAPEPLVLNCAGPSNADRCRGRILPTVQPDAAATP